MKAMILAAGRGERLRPLTDRVPKALVPVAGKPLIDWQLERLAAAGCREAVVNVSHLGELIVSHVGEGKRYGIRVAYSREREPLETAGGIAQALALLGSEPFLLVNADVYCDYDYSALIGRALGANLAHLVLVANPPHRPNGDFALLGATARKEGGTRYTYAGISLMSPKMVAQVKPGAKAALGPLLHAAAERGDLGAELYAGVWHDVGTRERLEELEHYLASRHAVG